ncbi:hypothetical protein ACGFYP_05325 [Streptomyces sp. NPDC048370]|uniref:hypothetical protein n=1 Tax=Streptomyces sp. NPDC048370 TaxID=3365540 RepID=UPI0037243E60
MDVWDVGAFTLDTAAKGGGPYNLVAPQGRDTMANLLAACLEVTGGRGELVWAE